MEEEDRGRVWRLYGWFTALMACGSCVGAVTWAAYMMHLVNIFKGNKTFTTEKVQKMSLFALGYSWQAAFSVTYAIEFMCLSVAKLMVLDRMSMFAAPQGTRLHKLWAAATRVVMAAVVIGNAVGLAANVASAVHYHKASEDFSAASSLFDGNSTNMNSAEQFKKLGVMEVQLGGSIASVQYFSEVAVLLLIVVAFVVVGVLSARRVSARLLGVDAASPAAATGRGLRRQMLGTTAFVFVTFLLRSVFSTMHAVAYQLRDIDKECNNTVCDACYNMYTHVAHWMSNTPEFRLMVLLVSSPVTLLVALWGMTSNTTLQLIKSTELRVRNNLGQR